MRSLVRDMRKVWVSLYSSKAKHMVGNVWTGEYVITRSEPFPIYPTLSAARGIADEEVFGTLANYDRTATLDHVNTGITETAVFWIDNVPEFDANGKLKVDANGQPTVPFDYVAERVAESPNVTSIALRKVDVA